MAIHAPHRLQRMVIINAPHSAAMRQQLRRHPAQWLRSAYIGWFQLPWIPELVTCLGRWRLLVRALQHSSRPGTFTPKDLERYRRAWSQPQTLRAVLNWYRALVRMPPRRPIGCPVTVPTLLLWGTNDVFLGQEMARASIEQCQQGQL